MHTSHALDLDQAISRVNGDLSLALKYQSFLLASECLAISKFLVRQSDLLAAKALLARARAAVRFLNGSVRHA